MSILDISSALPAVSDVYDVDLDAESGWGLSDILPSVEISIRFSLRADHNFIWDKSADQFVEAPATAACALKLVLSGFIPLVEQREFLVSVDRLPSCI